MKIFVLLLTALAASAQSQTTPAAKPDLNGVWRGPLLRNMDKNVPGGFAALFTADGKAAYDRNVSSTINPEGLCIFAGIPRASISGVPFRIVQSTDRVVFLYELMWTFRQIPTNGKQHPPDVEPSFFGHGTGRWDGDTLVVDTIGFKDKNLWLDDDAHPQSPNAHVVEKWRRVDSTHLAHEVTIDDPAYYKKPFTFDRVFTLAAPDFELMEFACNENNVGAAGGHLGFGPHKPSEYPMTPASPSPQSDRSKR